jgi:hypothetical protein
MKFAFLPYQQMSNRLTHSCMRPPMQTMQGECLLAIWISEVYRVVLPHIRATQDFSIRASSSAAICFSSALISVAFSDR